MPNIDILNRSIESPAFTVANNFGGSILNTTGGLGEADKMTGDDLFFSMGGGRRDHL